MSTTTTQNGTGAFVNKLSDLIDKTFAPGNAPTPTSTPAAEATTSAQPTADRPQVGASVVPNVRQDVTKAYSAELQDLVRRAEGGDESVLPQLKKALAEYPEIAAATGDLVRHALQALLATACGKNLLAKESMTAAAEQVRQQIVDEGASALEKLLADRIMVCWASVHLAEVEVQSASQYQLENPRLYVSFERHLDQANARYLAAIKTLATVRKLLRPSASPLMLAQKPVSEGPIKRPSCVDQARGGTGGKWDELGKELAAKRQAYLTLDHAMN